MAFPDGWVRRCALVIQSGQVTDNETNFPLLVTEDTLPSEIFDADGSYPALNGGGDIRFSSDEAGNTQLACEIESFVTDNDPANGKAAIWVKVPSLSSSTNTTIYCYSPDTEIMTEDGWKNIKDFVEKTEKIKVATLNPRTDKVEYYLPEKYFKLKNSGKMLHQSGKSIDYLVTANHRVYASRGLYKNSITRKRTGWKDYELIRADELPKNVKYKINFPYDNKEVDTFTIPAYKNEFPVRAGEQVFNGGKKGKKATYINKKERSEKTYNMDAFLSVLGIYLAEGSLRKGSVVISQQKKQNLNIISNWIKELGYKPLYTGTDFLFNDVQLIAYLKKFGHAKDKYIPAKLKKLSKRQLNILLNAMMLGDGHWYKEGAGYYATTSPRLADDFNEIALKAGYSSNIKHRKFTASSYGSSNDIIYLVTLYQSKETSPDIGRKTNREWIDYKGNVYCVQVPHNIIFTRRKGKSSWNGNCWYNKAGESQPAEDSAYGKENVWDANFKMVQHMNQIPDGTAGEIVDSTSNDNDGTTSGMDSADQVAGQIDGSLDFDGGDDYVGTSYNGILGTNARSNSFWFSTSYGTGVDSNPLIGWGTGAGVGTTGASWRINIENGVVFLRINGGATSWSSGLHDGNLHHVVLTMPSGGKLQDVRAYIDGVDVGLGSGAVAINTLSRNPVKIGTQDKDNNEKFFNGLIDEVRISNVARTAGWIATEFNNQKIPWTFLIEGTPETPGAPPITFIPQIIMF